MLFQSGVTLVAAKANAMIMATHATPSTAAATRTGDLRRSSRDNVDMPAVSQGLVEFANHHREPAAPGIEIIETPRYTIKLQPDFPIPGPNSVAWLRCRMSEVDEVIDEVHAAVAPRHLPIMWTLDPETRPPDLGDHLTAHGIAPDPGSPEAAVMVLPIDASIESPQVSGIAMLDALADPGSFRNADAVNSESFESPPRPDGALERRRVNQVKAGNRRVILATIDGEPAGSAGLTLYPPMGAIINGGAVRAKFRGLGVYRAMVAARLEMAREANVTGLAVWGGPMSAPILTRLGFQTVGWRRFYVDTSTV
jgi:GNAT superfamily N-acetyltransferase